MKILVVGSGAREHALAWKLSQEAEVIAAPGNPGFLDCCKVYPIQATDQASIVELARRQGVDLVVIGAENPLMEGLADLLRDADLPVFGPGAAGARLEGSKAFAKELMREAGVRTAAFKVFTDADAAYDFIDARQGQVVVKADGLAFGKGVVVCDFAAEAREAVHSMMVERAFGDAGGTVVIEDRLSGPEFSLMTLCSDAGIHSLPVAQDYKRAVDGDRGPNTGGMGSVSPVGWIGPESVAKTEDEIVRPTLAALRDKGIQYRGVLFSGLMMYEGEVHCLEYNVRFGDPETESQMLRLGSGFAAALKACADGQSIPPIEVLDNAAVTVAIASGGYPISYAKGKAISIESLPDGVHVFHAGTAPQDGQLVTAGGRVLAVSAAASSVEAARQLAYRGVEAVSFDGAYWRRDIAAT